MFDLLATPVALVLRTIHAGLSTFLAPSSGPAWALSIILLTITVRLLLFPLFVKQIKSQRRMQEIAPKVKDLQQRHKGDRETLNTEMMKLYKDHGANPISGCLPLLLQLPVFFALFTVVREFGPANEPRFGLSEKLLEQGGAAKVFGAPISAAFTSGQDVLAPLGASSTTVRLVSVVMIILMGATTFWTQRQMMARAAGQGIDPMQAQVQKILLYVLPLSFAVFGINFPVGVLLYWLTTNLWSMGQQAWVIKRMPPIGATPAPAAAAAVSRSAREGSGAVDLRKSPAVEETSAAPGDASSVGGATGTARQTGTSTVVAPAGRAAGSRRNKKKPRGGRR